MSGQMERFEWVSKAARLILLISLGILVVMVMITAAWGTFRMMESASLATAAPFAIALLAQVMLAGWAAVLYGVVSAHIATENSVNNVSARMGRLETLLDDLAKTSRKVSDLASLSEQAKSLLFREREIEAFREAIHAEMVRQNYQTAEALISAIETRFGYAEEARKFREEIDASRKATVQEKIDGAVLRVQETIASHDWARAAREALRLLRIFPTDAKVAALPAQVETARNRHKRDLLQEYGEAVKKNDIDRGIELLKELDLYLTPQEAAALEESARGVFRARLHNLGVQFAIRVTELQWADAVATGEEIIREFPNTRMAQEVRQKMDLLKSRAAAPVAT